MATMPPREHSLRETVESVIDQCDELNIYMNNWNHVPDFLHHPKINIFRSQENLGDLGDVGKFFMCDEWKGYIFTIDDKIIYPPDYTKSMIYAIEKYGRRAVVSHHGRIMKPDCESYYRDYAHSVSCLDHNPEDIFGHVLGTGVMAFHSSTFRFNLDIFESTNMSDIWMSIALQLAGIPIVLLKHDAGYIRLSLLQDNNMSISAQCSHRDQPQTDAVNAVEWHTHTCPLVL